LESWSADVIASLGGYENLSPNFEQLIRQGYLFTNIRAAGHMSDQGVPAILSAYPALTTGSVINQPERQVNLSGIVDQLKPLGYYSSFFYGGPLTFGNIKSYIYRNGYNRVMDKNDFPSSVPSGRLGIHDSIMLHIWLDSLSSAKQPFLSSLFTISTHAPFDEPFSKTINWGGMDNSYLNSVMYADQQLKIFFDQAKKQSWYANTLFILVADHSHGLPKHYAYDSYEYYHIPLLLYGGALKDEYRGIKDNRIGSQNDILATLLHQMNLPDTNYRWSKNLLNPFTQEFAFYTFDNGFGFADTTGVTVWNHKFPSESYSTGTDEAQKQLRLTKGHAMLQAIMKDYLSK
jgi:phosphoglycerol transferase MdoB-like AlkP superfamily enzyme